jgi:RNA polymerase sigma-70 factor, ECF subfamily
MCHTLESVGTKPALMNRLGGSTRQEGVTSAPGDRRADLRDDRSLLDAMADGDRTALRELYERHAPWLFIRLSRRCADRGLVEDVVQDTFVAVWRKSKSYRGSGEVAAWIWGIGIRRLIERFRRRRLPASMLLRPATVASAEEQVLLGVQFGDLAGAINSLSPELRAVVQATVLDGLSMREAARLLGIPTGTVKTRLSRARSQLRKALA